MHWLPKLSFRNPLKTREEVQSGVTELVNIEQTKALTTIGESLKELSTFITKGGLSDILKAYSQTQIVQGVLQGLAAHDGRNSLDARYLQQNATEIVHAIEAVFNKAKERAEANKQDIDSEIKDAENDYIAWRKKNES